MTLGGMRGGGKGAGGKGGVFAIALCLAPLACPSSPAGKGASASGGDRPTCVGAGSASCRRALSLLASASAFTNVKHDYILDPTSSFAPGRGVELAEGGARGEGGTWRAVPTACAVAQPQRGGAARSEAEAIDFGFVGVSVDNVLVGADADLTPFLSAGASGATHRVKLVAVAFVRDDDPQFFDASDAVSFAGTACACARATHFVGAVKRGGLLAYDLDARSGEAHGTAFAVAKARLEASDASIAETRVGGLEVEGLEDALATGQKSAGHLHFHVKDPVPIAYAVYPISDVCRFALPVPDVTPIPIDFGSVPYGEGGSRLVHVVNRAAIDLVATLGGRAFDVPARGSMDLPLAWSPRGDAPGCDAQTREEALVFAPKDGSAPAVPRQQSVRLVESVHTGRGAVTRSERVDTGEGRLIDYATTARDWTCPRDYVVAGCRAEHTQCADPKGDCTRDFVVTAREDGNGCHFACAGPRGILTKSYCRFDAVMDCRLRCGS